jgi:cell shape-determining protein MreC
LGRCGLKDVVFAGRMIMRRLALIGTTAVVPVALGLIHGIAYLGYADVQRQIKAQHVELQSLKDTQAELQSLKDKIQEMAAAAQSRTDVEQWQPSINELQGLLNHVDTLRVQAKQRHPKQQKQ